MPAPANQGTERAETFANARRGGDDDDDPIIMHKVVRSNGTPIPLADVKMIDENETDSIQLSTNLAGECTFTLPGNGIFHLKINSSGYQEIDTMINVVDSFSVRVNELIEQ